MKIPKFIFVILAPIILYSLYVSINKYVYYYYNVPILTEFLNSVEKENIPVSVSLDVSQEFIAFYEGETGNKISNASLEFLDTWILLNFKEALRFQQELSRRSFIPHTAPQFDVMPNIKSDGSVSFSVIYFSNLVSNHTFVVMRGVEKPSKENVSALIYRDSL